MVNCENSDKRLMCFHIGNCCLQVVGLVSYAGRQISLETTDMQSCLLQVILLTESGRYKVKICKCDPQR